MSQENKTNKPEEKKKKAINRLKSMYPLRALIDKQYIVSQEAERAGKPVAWCMVDMGIATPFLDSMGIETIFPENFGPGCAASTAASIFLERSGMEGFPEHLCGYCRNAIGYTSRMTELNAIPPESPPAGGMPKPTLLMATGRTCDAHYKTFQSLARYLDVPMWIIEQPHPGDSENLPEGAYDRDVKFMVAELKEFGTFLEKFMGKKMDWAVFEQTVNLRLEIADIWYEINELRKAVPGPMHSRDFWSSMSAVMFGGSAAVEAKTLFHNMYDEVKYRIDNKISAINYPEKYRMTFYVLPPWHSLGIFDKLAERGWNFVTEDAYHPPKPRDLSKIHDPVERLVRHMIPSIGNRIDDEFPPDEAAKVRADIMKYGYSHRLLAKPMQDFRIDGAFFQVLLTCRANTLLQPFTQDQLMKIAKVPSMSVDGDIVDISLFSEKETLEKAEVFEETMDHYRKIRKQAGFNW